MIGISKNSLKTKIIYLTKLRFKYKSKFIWNLIERKNNIAFFVIIDGSISHNFFYLDSS